MESLKNTTIMVVDDDADIRELLRVALEKAGASVVTATSVDEALQAFRRCPPHALVADIRLGDSDGYALLQAIRKRNIEYRGFTPAVAVTGYASADDAARARNAGFNAYVSKPFDPADVVAAVTMMLCGPEKAAA
jgi:CheY-like chemotaxis protein